MNYLHVAGVLVVQIVDQKPLILAVEREDQTLGLPAGKLEPDEDTAIAAVRECYEETSRVVVLRGKPAVYTEPDFTFVVYRADIAIWHIDHISIGSVRCLYVSPSDFLKRCIRPEATRAILNQLGFGGY